MQKPLKNYKNKENTWTDKEIQSETMSYMTIAMVKGKFKETEIGKIPEDWEVKELSKVANYISEKIDVNNLNAENYVSTESMLPNKGGITIANSLPKLGKLNTFKKRDILFSNIRTYFKKIWFANFDGACSSDVLVIRKKEDLDNLFLYYYLSQESFFNYTITNSKGTKMPRGDKNAIMQFKIYLPPSPEQKSIAKILSDLDSKIELLQKQNQTLEKIGQALFKHWFVDFEFPNEQGRPYKSSYGEMVDSELGKIPKGWETQRLSNLIIRNRNSLNDFDKWADKDLIDLSNMPRFSMSISNFEKGNKFKSNIFKVNEYDILYGSIRPYFGKYGFSPIKGVITGTIFSFLPKKQDYYSFILFTVCRKEFVEYTVRYSRGTKMPIIGWKDFSAYSFPIPSEDKLITKFNEYIFPMVNKIKENIVQIQNLSKIRDSLLPKLMSGKIRVHIKG